MGINQTMVGRAIEAWGLSTGSVFVIAIETFTVFGSAVG